MVKILTSESVTEGHPDKVCDRISDAILDAHLKEDKYSRVACECLIANNALYIGGEITSKARVDIADVARKTIKKIGYIDNSSGFDVDNADIVVNITKQSEDIAVGVIKDKINAGDQGMVYGFACDETLIYMPFTIDTAHKLAKRLEMVRKENIIKKLYPDGKTQVSAVYDKFGNVKSIDSVVIAAQHHKDADIGKLRCEIIEKVIFEVIDKKLLSPLTKLHINTTGVFSKGGPAADTGLTGRKIIVDTYGGIARHGGGAFSGKDASKADRTASYLARYIAKNVVAANLAKRCEVEMSFIIGKEAAQTIYINTFRTNLVSEEVIADAVMNTFDLTIDNTINEFNLRSPIYEELSSYGHFGRNPDKFLWERTDKVNILRAKCKLI